MNFCWPVVAMFFGSFLLFGIQPMLGRTLLPSFGGSASVWTVCLAAYQVLLLVGYGYAHALSRTSARKQRVTHLVLLGTAVAWTFVFAALRLSLRKHIGLSAAPSLEVLFCVMFFAGLPYVLLSASSTLIQSWLVGIWQESRRGTPSPTLERTPNPPPVRRDPRSVYKLYAVSNLGSLLGLLCYPFLLEPFISLNAQWHGFAVCLLIYSALLAAVAHITLNAAGESRGATLLGCDKEPTEPPEAQSAGPEALPAPLMRPWLWFALPAVSTFLLNAVTMHLTTDVSPVPMLWSLLLTAFLLSYILGFSAIGEKGLIVWAALSVLTLLGAGCLSGLTGGNAFAANLSLGVGTVLVCCTFLHAWLYRIRPDASRLTFFYLGIATGGALGGSGAALLSPLLFNSILEYPLGLIATCAACAWLIRTWRHSELKSLNTCLLFGAGLAAFLTLGASLKISRQTIFRARNFYGCLTVDKENATTSFGEAIPLFKLKHGETLHGTQFCSRFLKDKPTSYYGTLGGGIAVLSHTNYAIGTPMRVGLIGLGAGTMAVYGRSNDVYRFFEINPQVIHIASNTNYFTFVSDSAAHVEFVLGDARNRLAQESGRTDPKYDVLVLDAYSGDSVPFHLATREAFALYLERLSPNGILAIHISNWHLNLAPLCKAVAATYNLYITGVISPETDITSSAQWVFLTRQVTSFKLEGIRELNWDKIRIMSLPSDEQGSLLSLICFRSELPMQDLDFDR